jgi:hypothetical protein
LATISLFKPHQSELGRKRQSGRNSLFGVSAVKISDAKHLAVMQSLGVIRLERRGTNSSTTQQFLWGEMIVRSPDWRLGHAQAQAGLAETPKAASFFEGCLIVHH